MNEHDSERLAVLLVADGLAPASTMEDADVVVLNTCCIRENADQRLYGTLGRLKELVDAKPGLQIAVGGCLAQKDRELIVERAGHVDVVFGTHNLANAASLLERARFEGPVVEILEEHEAYPSALPARRAASSLPRHSAWVTIQVGCDNSCTFCIVPIVRGPEISRRLGDIVREVEELAADGVREITVLGQNVNSYGRDLGAGQYRPQFADLLRALDAVDGIDRIRFTSPHPKDLRPETIAAMAECASVCEHLHLPLQAGSDRTLARMHRGYTAERYLRRLADARAAIPDLAVTTDLIVGFPGETTPTSNARSRWSTRRTTPRYRSSSHRARNACGRHDRRLRRPRGRQNGCSARQRGRASRPDEARGAGRPHRAAPRRGTVEARSCVWSGCTRQNKLVHFEPDVGEVAAPPTSGSPGAAPHFRGDLVD
jgi:tRNA-2-methylthio-N6-dimethylallyladenosine synthase